MLRIDIVSMAYSDHMVLEALKQLLPENPNPTYELISRHLPIRCERTTIWRALKRLESQKLIRRSKGARSQHIELITHVEV